MTTATRVHQLRRVNDQKTIQRACETRMAGAEPATISLLEVAELCKRDYAGRPCRDLHAVRNQLFLIATEWDLDRDLLDQQSDARLRAVADFLR